MTKKEKALKKELAELRIAFGQLIEVCGHLVEENKELKAKIKDLE